MASFFKRIGVSLYPKHIEWLRAETKKIQKYEKRSITTSEVVRRLIENDPSYQDEPIKIRKEDLKVTLSKEAKEIIK